MGAGAREDQVEKLQKTNKRLQGKYDALIVTNKRLDDAVRSGVQKRAKEIRDVTDGLQTENEKLRVQNKQAFRKVKVLEAKLKPKDATGNTECAICWDGDKTHACVPCGHKQVCTTCADKKDEWQICPICRADVREMVKVYD